MWFYFTPSIIFGEDSLSWLEQIEGKKAFIVTDSLLERLGYPRQIQALLSNAGIESRVFSQVEPDPVLETVEICAQDMLVYNPDLVIGLGGGSAMDAAKAAWFRYENPDTPLETINPFDKYEMHKKARLINIPTTSGTGADVSWGFALANPATQSKLVGINHSLVPDMSILDPCLTTGLPPRTTASTGMDTLTHAVEAFSCAYHNDFSDAMALKAIELVFNYLPAAFHDGHDCDAREHLHNAATMAGIAFSNTAITLAHALGHNLGCNFHTHHGQTVGMFLPYTIQYNARLDPERFAQIAYHLHLPFSCSEEGARRFTAEVRALQLELQEPLTIAEMGISRHQLEQVMQGLVENTLNGVEVTANPRMPTPKEIERLYWYAYDGRDIDF